MASKKLFVLNISLISLILGVALASFFHFSCSTGLPSGNRVYAQDSSLDADELQALENLQLSFRKVAEKVIPVVVQINTTEMVTLQSPRLFLAPFDQQELPRSGLGSGILVQRDGKKVYVLSNNHVVGNADKIKVILSDQREYSAQLIGSDPNKDLALIAFETREDIQLAELGDSDTLEVGDWVFAVGNPFGYTSTITVGIVSALGRRAARGLGARYTDFIQTDAAINQGNSGGALVNIYGEVVGINSWIATETGVNAGVGFTVPINNAKQAIEDFITKGRIEYGWLGVTIGDPSSQTAEDFDIVDIEGSMVQDVFADSPAYEGGILPGDYITEVNGTAISNSDDLLVVIGSLRPGQMVDFSIIRYKKSIQREVKIGVRESDNKIQVQHKSLWPGFSTVRLTADIRAQLSVPSRMEGLVVYNVSEGTKAANAGLQAGDIILKINNKPTRDLLQFYRTVNENEKLLVHIYRQENELQIDITK